MLLEFVNADQFPGRISPLFPVIAGVLKRRGQHVRWLRFALSTTNLMAHGRDEVTLTDEEMETLLSAARSDEPGLVLTTDRLHLPQAGRLAHLLPGAVIHHVDFASPPEPLTSIYPGALLSGVPPSYRFEPANSAAFLRRHDNVHLLTGSGCGNSTDAWRSPCYEKARSASLAPHLGCAFCTAGLGAAPRSGEDHSPHLSRTLDEVSVIRLQLEALAADRMSPRRLPNAVLLERVASDRVLKETLACMDELGLSGRVRLSLSSRTDQVPRIEKLFERHLERSPESRIKLGVHACGIESFAQGDLDLFNKQTTTLDGLRAVSSLRRLASSMPTRFQFTGISFLLFSPWTSLAALYQTVSLARLLEITRKEAGNIFQARMRLHEGLPVTMLADQEGLLETDEPDEAVVMNRRKLFSAERPWRFSDPRVRSVCRLTLRFDLLGRESSDPLTEALLSAIRDVHPKFHAGDDLFLLDYLLCMIEEAGAAREALCERALLERSFVRYRAVRERQPAKDRFRLGLESCSLPELLERVSPLIRSGKKPLLSIEGVREDELPACLEDLSLSLSRGTLRVARDTETVSLAERLSGLDDSSSIEKLGLLHGLPECCARAFARAPKEGSQGRLWAAYAKRCESAFEVPPISNPFWAPALSFVPCSADCPRAVATWRSWYELACPAPPSQPEDVFVCDLSKTHGEMVRVLCKGDDLSYDPARVAPAETALGRRLAMGNRLRILPGQIQILDHESVVDFLPARHVPWSSKRSWHRPEYRELAGGVELVESRRPRKDRRLLLLEFVTCERWVWDGRFFPFIKGGAEDLGWEVTWLCFGARLHIDATGSPSRPSYEQCMDLGSDDTERLSRMVREIEPTHVFMSHPPSAKVLRVLREGGGEPVLLSTSDMQPPEGVTQLLSGLLLDPPTDREGSKADLDMLAKIGGSRPLWRIGRTDWLLSWLGVPRDRSADYGKYMAGAFRPAYEAVMANAKAREYRPHLLVVGGVVCDHFRKVTDDPRYRDVDLSKCDHVTGCAYCTWYRGPSSEMRGDPLPLAEEQLARMAESADKDTRYRGVVDILDIRLFTRIDRFADMVLRLDLPPTTFCFEPRVDRVIQVAGRLEEALPRLSEAGHSVRLFRMGAENLVEEENRRFNKDVGYDALQKGMRILENLAEQHPRSFSYDPTFGYITCSPWTTLEMLESTIERGMSAGFSPLGVWLYTPLLLFGAAPITRLAEQHGLVQDDFDDLSLLWEPAINGCPIETIRPWRFEDRRTAAAFALIVRFCAAALRGKYPDSLFESDDLYARLLGGEQSAGPFDRPDLFAREVVAVVREFALDDRGVLLEAALARYASLPKGDEVMGRRETGGSEQAISAEYEDGGRLPAPPPDSPDETALAWGREFERVLRGVCGHLSDSLGRIEVGGVAADPSGESLHVDLTLEGERYLLRVRAFAPGVQRFVRTRHFAITHDRTTPPRLRSTKKRLEKLFRLTDAAAMRHAPGALPPARAAAGARAGGAGGST